MFIEKFETPFYTNNSNLWYNRRANERPFTQSEKIKKLDYFLNRTF